MSMTIPLANYESEREHFHGLLKDNSKQRILMFQAQSGMGKSRLFQACIDAIPAHVPYVSVQLKGTDTNVSDVMLRMGRRIRWANLATLISQIANLLGTPEAHYKQEWRVGIRQHLQAALFSESVEDRRQRHGLLTDAMFRDLRHFDQPFLLALDTYEQANTEIDNWVSQQLLPWVADTRCLRVLLLGQNVPELSADWLACCNQQQLLGVIEAEAWLPVAEAMGRAVPSIEYLAGACAIVNGNPRQILQFIEALPLKQIQPKIVRIDARIVRNNLDEGFNRDELDDLCFELGLDISYEELKGDTHRAKCLDLLRYIKRHGRLPELLAKGRELRPHFYW